eukprot:11826717-Alexandrium_andersonii.AAC.1
MLDACSSSPAFVAALARKATRPVIPVAVGPSLIPGIHIPRRVAPRPRSHRVYGLCRVAVV